MERPDDDAGAIYEAPDEDELASSPPGSLSHQEIMSEHIQSRIEIHKFGKPAPAATVFRDQISETVS